MPQLDVNQRRRINRLTLKMILAAGAGTVAAAVIAYFLRKTGFGDIRPELLFIPWSVALVIGISAGFRYGVLSERDRQASGENE